MERKPNLTFDPSSRMARMAANAYSSPSDSDADSDYDEFDIPSTNPNADDEFRDFNPRKRRRTGRTGRDAKERAALGIFGSESEDEAGPGKRWKRKTNLRSKGVSFVSSDRKATAEDIKDEGEHREDVGMEDEYSEDERPSLGLGLGAGGEDGEEDEDGEEEEEDEEATPGIGLGFVAGAGSGLGGLGWGAAATTQKPQSGTSTPQRNPTRAKFDDSTPLGQGFIPSSANEPVLKVPEDAASAPKLVARPSAFSASGKKKGKAAQSFGARMMAKMGYVEGQGLGKEGQGRNVLVEANLRPQNVGLGAVREKTEHERKEERRQARLRGEEVVDSDEEEKKKKKAAAARRKKGLAGGVSSGASGATTPKRQKPKYMTLDEVKKAAPGLNIPDAFTPILDLTGPGKKLLTSSSGLMTPTAGSAAQTVEEVESRKLARRAQNDFMAILEEWQGLQERKAYTDLQLRQEQQEIEELESGLRGYQPITTVLAQLSPLGSNQTEVKDQVNNRLDQVISLLRGAQEACSEAVMSVMRDELAAIAVAAIHPLFKHLMAAWDPLEDPKPRMVADLLSIKTILGIDAPKAKTARRATATPYEAMMFKFWLPQAARAVREWNVRESDQLLAVVEAWDKLLPGFVRAQLLEQDIARKLDEAVAKWEPKRRRHHNLPHLWLFPWLQYLAAHHLDPKSTTGLVADVKRKFRQLIDVWEFDKGVIPGLKQWREVLRPSKSNDQWRPLVMNHVLPGMARYLRTNFRVDPSDQAPYVPMLSGIFEWTDVVSPSMIGEVIVAEVFPRWHETLYQWLILDEVNYEEVGQWFGWWNDEVFPEEIRSLPSISAELEKGNAMIEQALDLGERVKTSLPKPQKGPAYEVKRPAEGGHHHHHAQTPTTTTTKSHHPAAGAPTTGLPEEEVSFRSVLEDWCQNNDLQFIPERKKVHAEGPLYRVTARGDGRGGVLGYFKGGDRFCVEMKQGGVQEFPRDSRDNWMYLFELAH